MEYLGRSFKIFGKNFMFFIPMFIVQAIYFILYMPANDAVKNMSTNMQSIMPQSGADMSSFFIEFYKNLFMTIMPSLLLSMGVSFILSLFIMPGTYGAIKKVLVNENAQFSDFFTGIEENFLKYIIYLLGTLLLGIIVASLVGIVVFISYLLWNAIGALGVVIGVILGIALFILLFAISFMIQLWFPAMVIDNLGLFEAFKKSLIVTKEYFWPIVGQMLLVGICFGVINGFVSIVNMFSPIAYSILAGALVALNQFILVAYSMVLYYERTDRGESLGETNELTEF